MILQSSSHIDYFIITVFLSPLIVFLLIKLTLHLTKRKQLNRGVIRNLLHFAFSIIISALFFYIYDLYGTHQVEKYLKDQFFHYSDENEVSKNNYKNYSWDRKLLSHDGFYVIDERLTFEKDGKIKLFNRGIRADNWFALKSILSLNEGVDYNTYNHIYDSLYVCEKPMLFGDTAYFFYNDSLKVIETDLHY